MGQKNSSSHLADAHDSDDSENLDRKSPAVSPNYRDIILECFGNASSDTASRIMMRIGQQRSDFKMYKENLTHEQVEFLTNALSQYLLEVIENIDDVEKVKEISMDYGARHVSFRLNGFKPDFFAAMADAIATECSFLSDSATAHAPTNTFKAWTLLVGLMFSSVRDGFYKELRRQRRQSPSYLKSSRESSTSLEYLAAQSEVKQQKDSAPSENSHHGIEYADNDKTITASTKLPSMLAITGSEEKEANQQTSSLPTDSGHHETKARPIDIPKRLHRYQKSKSTSVIPKPESRSAEDNYHTSHMERLKRAMKARTPTPDSSNGPVIGRFMKNPTALAEYDAKRHHRLDEIIKHHAYKHSSSKLPPSTTPTFDPNKIIDDFMNDRYKV